MTIDNIHFALLFSLSLSLSVSQAISICARVCDIFMLYKLFYAQCFCILVIHMFLHNWSIRSDKAILKQIYCHFLCVLAVFIYPPSPSYLSSLPTFVVNHHRLSPSCGFDLLSRHLHRSIRSSISSAFSPRSPLPSSSSFHISFYRPNSEWLFSSRYFFYFTKKLALLHFTL